MGNSAGGKRKKADATKLAHSGRHPAEHHGFVNIPVYRGSTVLYPNAAALAAHDTRYPYGRRGTPTMEGLQEAIADLDGADGCLTAPSGLAAISNTLLCLVRSGDHILMTDSVYFPTRRFCDQILRRFGVETEYYDPLIGGDIAGLMRPNTRIVYTESPGSRTMEVQDLPAIAAAAHAAGAFVVIDNTWATPLYFRSLEKGADVSVHAGTKYFGGHSDIMLGAVTANGKAWRELSAVWHDFGNCAGTEEMFLGLRGLRTMEVRLARHMQSALEIAGWLAERPEVDIVLHPALEGAPGHELWKRDFTGASGLFSVILKPVPAAAFNAMLDGLELFGLGYSWGGYESLAIPFDPAERRTPPAWADSGPGVRFHIGLEDVGDLKADLAVGFERLAAASPT
ncbi:MAG TPA: cystathionine beta-lyase [Hyphomicrobiales bacterium]|nr:cystathionine beta-lyase [Hyphomicrobiales bacterium]